MAPDILEQHGELVAAETGRGVRWPERLLQTARDHRQQLIPRGMSEAVVDLFEVVEVGEEYRSRLRRSTAARKCPGDSIHEERAVGESR